MIPAEAQPHLEELARSFDSWILWSYDAGVEEPVAIVRTQRPLSPIEVATFRAAWDAIVAAVNAGRHVRAGGYASAARQLATSAAVGRCVQ